MFSGMMHVSSSPASSISAEWKEPLTCIPFFSSLRAVTTTEFLDPERAYHPSHLIEGIGEACHPLQEFSCQGHHFLGIFLLPHADPGILDDLKHGEEVRLTGNDNSAVEGLVPLLPEVLIVELEGALIGHEHHHVVQGIPACGADVPAVAFGRQFPDMGVNALAVCSQGYAALCLVSGIDVCDISFQRHLGVDYHRLVLRQVEHHIGDESPPAVIG